MAAERLQVILELVTGQYKKEAREAATSTKAIGAESEKTGGGLSKMSTSMKLAAGAAAAFVASRIVGFLGDAAKAAGEDDKSQRLLALAIENTTNSTQTQIDKNEQWIDGLARATGVADDQLRPALANLVRTHGDLSTAQGDLGVALDISAAKGLDVETVAKAMAKAHDGNTGALKKLGLQVQDTEGNMLTYEQVLAKASETMGGAAGEAAASLAGQLERQSVAWEETQERIGAGVIPILSRLGGIFSILAAELGPATEQSIARMSVQFNNLVNSGVDPAADKVGSFVRILQESQETVDATAESVDVLAGMIGLSGGDFLTAATAIKEAGGETWFLNEANRELVKLLEVRFIPVLAAARGVLSGHTADILDNVSAVREQIDATRELVDPLFALEKATDRAREAEADYNEAVRLHGDYSTEAYDASILLAGAQLDLNAASATWAEEGGAGSLQVLRDTLEQAGLMPDVIQDIIDRWVLYNDTPVKAKYPIVFDPKTGKPVLTPIAGVFHEGGVVPGGQNDEVLILAKGGERVIPNNMLIPPGGQGRLGSQESLTRGGGQTLQVHVHYPQHTGDDILSGIQRAVGLAGLVHFAEVTSGES